MARERYPGERRGLTLFLEGLLPEAEAACGRDSLLFHAIRRALRTGDLDHLRHARKAFNHLPRELRQQLSGAVVARSRASVADLPPEEVLATDAAGERRAHPFVTFESKAGGKAAARPPRVAMTHELLPPQQLRVLVTPGTLPAEAASGLRQIADMIERDRRLLSERFWRTAQEAAAKRADGPGQPGHHPRLVAERPK